MSRHCLVINIRARGQEPHIDDKRHLVVTTRRVTARKLKAKRVKKRKQRRVERRKKGRKEKVAVEVAMKKRKMLKLGLLRWLESLMNSIHSITMNGPTEMSQIIRSKLTTGHCLKRRSCQRLKKSTKKMLMK